MKASCKDLQEVLRREDPVQREAIEAHAAQCERCRGQILLWEEISQAASGLRRSWESPRLWPGIREALLGESRKPMRRFRMADLFADRGRVWLSAAAAALLFVISAAGLWVFRASPGGREPLAAGPWRYQEALMTDQAFGEVESREKDYIASINNLSKLVEPRLETPASPLLVSYKEKLLLLDAAIAETRSQIEQNRFNTHLRRELLAMYAEKQRTLQELMKEAQS